MCTSTVLSVIVPTYNRPQFISDMVNEIFRYPFDDIRLYIYDNSENYETRDILDQFNDSRLIYVKNDKNIGAYNNFLSVFNITSSTYQLLVIDRDHLSSEFILRLRNKLSSIKTFNVGYVQVREHVLNDSINETFYISKYAALKEMVVGGKHPTGWIFSSDFIRNNQTVKNSLLSGEVYLYPHELFISKSHGITPYVCFNVNKKYSFGNKINYLNSKSEFSTTKKNTISWADQDFVYPDFKARLINILNIEMRSFQKFKLIYLMYSSMISRVTTDAVVAYRNFQTVLHYDANDFHFSKKKAIVDQYLLSKIFLEDFSESIYLIRSIVIFAGLNNIANILFPVLRHLPRNPIILSIKIYNYIRIQVNILMIKVKKWRY